MKGDLAPNCCLFRRLRHLRKHSDYLRIEQICLVEALKLRLDCLSITLSDQVHSKSFLRSKEAFASALNTVIIFIICSSLSRFEDHGSLRTLNEPSARNDLSRFWIDFQGLDSEGGRTLHSLYLVLWLPVGLHCAKLRGELSRFSLSFELFTGQGYLLFCIRLRRRRKFDLNENFFILF